MNVSKEVAHVLAVARPCPFITSRNDRLEFRRAMEECGQFFCQELEEDAFARIEGHFVEFLLDAILRVQLLLFGSCRRLPFRKHSRREI